MEGYNALFEEFRRVFWEEDLRAEQALKCENYARRCLEEMEIPTLGDSKYQGRQIVVSLTSIPKRFQYVWVPITCMFAQTLRPTKVVLYVGEDADLSELESDSHISRLLDKGLEIRSVEDIGPHTKYFYAMQDFPEDYVITIDDDVIYRNHMIRDLFDTLEANPDSVCANWVWEMRERYYSTLEGFWHFKTGEDDYDYKTSHALIALGVGGVLYPPHALPEETFDPDKIRSLALKADDLWLKAMEINHGTRVAKVPGVYRQDVQIDGSQEVALSLSNHEGGNDAVLAALFREYDLFNKLRESGDVHFSEIYPEIKTKDQKYWRMFLILEKWMQLKQAGGSLDALLQKLGAGSVSIYGSGHLGKMLLDDLSATKVDSRIDRSFAGSSDEACFDLDSYIAAKRYDQVDMIILTPVGGMDEVIQSMPEEMLRKLWTLEDVLDER